MRITCVSPFDFALSWRAFSFYAGSNASERGSLAMWWEDKPTSLYIKQTSVNPPVLEVIVDPIPRHSVQFWKHLRDMLHADLDLKPFYRAAEKHPRLRKVVEDLRGLKPFRPPDIFQMVVTAVSEQQVSMEAARSVRERLLSAFGTRTGRLTVFPRPGDLAEHDPRELRDCGLSQRKAESLVELARRFARGEVDVEAWNDMPDGDLVRLLTSLPGVGEWTAEYILVRGLGRLDVVPAEDLGVRRAVGTYLGDGKLPTPQEVRETLEPWSPWRGLLCFYLMAHQRMTQMGLDQAQ